MINLYEVRVEVFGLGITDFDPFAGRQGAITHVNEFVDIGTFIMTTLAGETSRRND
jgi:hypothetical protein